MSKINFKLLCEQALFEARYNPLFLKIAGEASTEEKKYIFNKRKDPQAALAEYNKFRLNARRRLSDILVGLPLKPNGSPISTPQDVDDYIMSVSAKSFPSLRHLTSYALPQDESN